MTPVWRAVADVDRARVSLLSGARRDSLIHRVNNDG
jgi:hypothetical protein